MAKKTNTLNNEPKPLVAKCDYFGISAGDHVNVIETIQGSGQIPTIHKCLVKRYREEGHWNLDDPKKPQWVVDVEGGDAIHYMYGCELKEYDVDKIIEDGILFLAGNNSISAGRVLTDILKHIDGGEMPSELKEWRLCPSNMTSELLKVVGDQGLLINDALDIVDGKRTKKVMRQFVKVYYKLNFQHIKAGVKQWDTLKTVVGVTEAEVK